MATIEQIPEAGELTPDQLKIGTKYRVVEYGRPLSKVPHKLLRQSLATFEGPDKDNFHYMNFRIVAPRPRKGEEEIVPLFIANSPAHRYYNKYFQTAQDRLVTPFKQKALNQLFSPMGESTAHFLSDGWFKPNERPTKDTSKKLGGRKYKTRQIKVRRQNRSKKNRRRRHN
jgi:hypothetical protein